MRKPTLASITVRRRIDCNPDQSWIGEYGVESRENAIDRKERGDMASNRECRYFYPANPEYAEQDYERMEAYNRQLWWMTGVQAEAQVRMSGDNPIIQTFYSGGLWGIESDLDENELADIVQDQLADLKDCLEQFNVDMSNWHEIEIKQVEG